MPETPPATDAGTPGEEHLRGWPLPTTIAVLVLAVAGWGWMASRQSRGLALLKQHGAIFDTTATRPWIRLVDVTLTDDDLDALASLSSLQQVFLDRSSITNEGLQRLGSLPELELLSLNRTGIGDPGLQGLRNFPALKTLSLDSAYRVTDIGLGHLAAVAGLKDLSIRETPITLVGLVTLSAALPSLQIRSTHGLLGNRKLALSGTEITDAGLVRLRTAKALRGLDLPSRIGDAGLVHLHQLPGLRYLEMAGSRVSDAGLAGLCERLPAIEELNLTGCRRLTDNGLSVLGQLKDLRQIKLDYTAAGSAAVEAVASLRALELLSLNGCRDLDDAALNRLLSAGPRPQLKFLRISRTGISDASVASLTMTLVPRLAGLDLRYTAVTEATVKTLRQRLTGCRVLD